jgi:carbon storage regulator
MLVLSRKQGEQLVIAGNITITVVEVRGDKVRLAFDAPGEVSIHRQEVWQRISAQRDQSADAGRLQHA